MVCSVQGRRRRTSTMAISHPSPADGPPRRVVLVDFDWRDADLVPELLRQPTITIGLVAGEGPDDPGVRLAELCGVPHTIELSDLTREIFDLALIGENSGRRSQLERVLAALGTPVETARGWLAPKTVPADYDAAASLRDDDSFYSGASAATRAREALDDLLPDFPSEHGNIVDARDVPAADDHDTLIPEAEMDPGLPGPEDRDGLERTLQHWTTSTDARAAEIHMRRDGEDGQVSRSGPEDRMLDALVNLAIELGRPHVMNQLEGPERGKAWAAWPFRTTIRTGCVAAAAIDPVTGRAHWEHLVDDLRSSWDLEDRETIARLEQGGKPYTGTPRGRLDIALQRNRDEGLRYEAHRLSFPATQSTVEEIAADLTSKVRDSDFVHPLGSGALLLLCSGPPAGYALIRRRLLAAWEDAWRESGGVAPAPPFTDERIELLDSLDADRFHAIVLEWITTAGDGAVS